MGILNPEQLLLKKREANDQHTLTCLFDQKELVGGKKTKQWDFKMLFLLGHASVDTGDVINLRQSESDSCRSTLIGLCLCRFILDLLKTLIKSLMD